MRDRWKGKLRDNSATQVKPGRADILQRKCACGQHSIGGSNCAACAKKEETLQRSAAHGKESAHETRAVPASVHQVLNSPGQPLDTATRSLMESRFGQNFSQVQAETPLLKAGSGGLRIGSANDRFEQEADHAAARVMGSSQPGAKNEASPKYDFSHVRVHTDEKAAESAGAVNALAYTVGHHVVFGAGQYALGSTKGIALLAHELTHVLQQQQGDVGLRRAPTPDTSQPRTFIIVYGSGQVNPETNQHNVGAMFRIVAAQKLAEIKARLGKKANQHTFVFEYTPTEAELKKVLNKKYAAPVAEVHIFSHGWEEGANLGGPVPPDLKKRPTETPEETQQRRLIKEDLGNYDIDFADDAAVVFYGCNIGNVQQALPDPTFAQQFSDAFGVGVTASTKSTHFENKGGWHQVPDTGGKMLDFTPTPTKVQAEVASYKTLLKQLITKKAELATPVKKGGLIGVMIREDRLRSAIETLKANIEKRRALVHRLIRFLPEAERAALIAEEEAALK